MMSNSDDDESSPAMQFTRSVRRIGRRPALASPSDSENTPSSAVKASPPQQQQRQQTAAYGFLSPQQLVFRGPDSPAEKVASPAQQAAMQQPYRGQQAAAQKPTPSPARHIAARPLSAAQQQTATTGSPATPAAGRLGPLDLNDPYTPWLRTSTKPPLHTSGTAGLGASSAGDLACSPLSSASSASSGRHRSSCSPTGDAPAALAELCAAVADLQLKQEQVLAAGSLFEGGGGPAAAVAAEHNTPTGAAAQPPARPAGVSNSSSDDEDESAPMTLGRRTAPRVFRRPILVADSDSSDGGSSSEPEGDGSASAADGCCATAGAHRRVTPGSSSSLIARRPPSSGKGSWRPGPTDTGYTDAYDFDAHLSTIKPPRWQQQRHRQHQAEQGSMTAGPVGRSRFASPRSPASTSPLSPVAALAFTPAPRGQQAVAGSPAVGPRRLSQSFLGAGLPLSPPVLKQQQPGGARSTLTPPAAAGRRGVHTARPHVQPAAAPPAFGTVLWPMTADVGSPNSSNPPPGDFTPSRRRGKGVGGQQGGPAAKGAATAPAKVPSSRTFARQRQQLAQELYAQWNAQVFGGGLPADLPVVWNPRLTATAGQVVDDGSRNSEKSSRAERIPVRLELSSKVLDSEARLRTTLSHEMCHVAAWVISREWKEHHGAVFWDWARKFEALVPGIKITTCHNFDVHAPFRWQCSNHSCGKLYVRHKRSIDTNKHVCSRCSGRLLYLGKFSRDGKVVAGSVPGQAGGAATPGGGNAFTMYVKTHFAEVKRGLPTGTPHKEVMTRLAAQYKEHKTAAAAAATPPAAPAAAQPRPARTAAAVSPAAPTEAAEPSAAAAPSSRLGVETAAVAPAAAVVACSAVSPAPPADVSSEGEEEGWQTAEEEVEDQTSSLLSFMDRLALS